MSPLGYQKMSATPCNQNAEESFPVLSLKSREQEPPNPLLIRDKAFYRLAQTRVVWGTAAQDHRPSPAPQPGSPGCLPTPRPPRPNDTAGPASAPPQRASPRPTRAWFGTGSLAEDPTAYAVPPPRRL